MKLNDYVFIPEEIIAEILLRLSVKPLFRLKCISKQWNSIISDPNFQRNYMNRTSKSKQCLWGNLPQNIGFIPTSESDDIDVPSVYIPILGQILSSSNGLLLCSNSAPFPLRRYSNRLCVCNPLTKQSIDLPEYSGQWSPDNIFCLSTRPDKQSYKVVAIRTRRRDCTITIYSSDTKRWSDDKREVKNYPAVLSESDPLTYSNGILYWFDFKKRTMVTYDPYNSPDRFGCIDLPSVGPRHLVKFVFGVRVIQVGQDVVKFGEIEDRGDGVRRLIVWRMYDTANGEFCIEQTCLISPSWKLTEMFEGFEGDYFCCLGVDDEVCVSRPDIIHDVSPLAWRTIVPFVLCPWASPYACSSARGGGGGEDEVKFRKVSPRWFSASNKYTPLLEWYYR